MIAPHVYIQSDIPEGMTIAAYRRRRSRLDRQSNFYLLTFLWSAFGFSYVTRGRRTSRR